MNSRANSSTPTSERRASAARAAAADAVSQALTGDAYVNESLQAWRESGRLADARDAGLAHEVAAGTMRHAITLDRVLGACADYDRRRTPAFSRAVLLTAVYQLIYLERIPEFAALDEAVRLARRRDGQKAGRFVNAVLRRVNASIAASRTAWTADDPRLVRVSFDAACAFRKRLFADPRKEPAGYLAGATGLKRAFVERMLSTYDPAVVADIAWASQSQPPIVLRRCGLRIDAEVFAQRVAAEFGPAARLVGDAVFLPTADVADKPLFREGASYVQDPTAHAAALAVEAEPGEHVLDLCAAPGGKSLCIAGQLGDSGRLLACDPEASRVRLIEENVRRLGLACVETAVLEESPLPRVFDAAMVDVPCSNTGVLARRVEARHRWTSRSAAQLAPLQLKLLKRAAAAVKPGGRVIYSTCSIEVAENEAVASSFLLQTPGWRLAEQQITLPRWTGDLADHCDGGYWARLENAE